MRVICRGRQGGKTEEAIRIANETGAHVVVATREEVERIAHLCKRYPVTFREVCEGTCHFARKLVFDNAEWMFQQYIASRGFEIEAITLTGEENAGHIPTATTGDAAPDYPI